MTASLPPTLTAEPCPTCGQRNAMFNGAHFRAVRKRAGVTLREMARRMNVSDAYVSRIERGEKRFRVKYVLHYRRLSR